MSENSDSNSNRSSLGRKISVSGLTQAILSSRSSGVAKTYVQNVGLTMPSQVNITGNSVVVSANKNLCSNTYKSGNCKLGGLSNSSDLCEQISAKADTCEALKRLSNDDKVRSGKQNMDLVEMQTGLLQSGNGLLSKQDRNDNACRTSLKDVRVGGCNNSMLQTKDMLQISKQTTTTTCKSGFTEDNELSVSGFDVDTNEDPANNILDTNVNAQHSQSTDFGFSSSLRTETSDSSCRNSVINSSSLAQFEPLINDHSETNYLKETLLENFKPVKPKRHTRSKIDLNILGQGQKEHQTVIAEENRQVVNSDIGAIQTLGQDQTKSLEGQKQGADNTTPVARPRLHKWLSKRTLALKKLEGDEYIGFASLPEQVHRKAVRKGFEFTLMVVGETGLGKSTLINSLFLMDLYKDRKFGTTEERVQKTVELEKKELEIEERGVKLKLTIVDTPGFNDAINAEESWKPIVNYIDQQFDSYYMAESGLNRKNIQDTRVHCCLYFISPYGHGLRPVDVLVMKKLDRKVNLIPLIAKADMLTKQEVKQLKQTVLTEIEKHKIQIYQYPDCDSDEDEEFKQQDLELKKSIPFAVVGSNTVVEAGGRRIRGRMYPWGIVEVENPQHCDFIKLRQMLISTHMQDLKDITCDVHYENFRAEHICQQMATAQRERGKLKRDSVVNLDISLETEKLLHEKEAEIKRMQDMLKQMQAQLKTQNSPRPNGKTAQV